MIDHIDYADKLLRRFFNLLPSLYGSGSQVLSMHNLIHVADDARTYQVPLIDISAFWGENYLGLFKNLVRSPHKPLTQIINRLEELESGNQMKVRRRAHVSDILIDRSCEIRQFGHQSFLSVKQIKIYGATLKLYHPNNCVQLKNGNIFLVNKILATHRAVSELQDIYVIGHEELTRQEAFNAPTSSIDVHLVSITEFMEKEKLVCAIDIKYKCVLLKNNGNQWVISLLHTYD